MHGVELEGMKEEKQKLMDANKDGQREGRGREVKVRGREGECGSRKWRQTGNEDQL